MAKHDTPRSVLKSGDSVKASIPNRFEVLTFVIEAGQPALITAEHARDERLMSELGRLLAAEILVKV